MQTIMTGFRMLRRQGMYGLIAVLGLTIGLTVAILAMLHMWAEFNHDAHVPNAHRLAMIDARIENPGRTPSQRGRLPIGLADAALADPDIEASTRVWRQYSSLTVGDRLDFNEIVANVDANFLDLFGVKIIAGTGEALNAPAKVLLSESMGARLFPDAAGPSLSGVEALVGQTFEVDGQLVEVGGIFADWPNQSHMDFDVLGGMNAVFNRARSAIAGNSDAGWRGFSVFTYILMRDGADADAVAGRMQNVFARNWINRTPLPEGTSISDIVTLSVQPLSQLHLNGKSYVFVIKQPADLLQLAVLGAISALIVLIASINHINLSTVRSMERAREVAIRKLMGAGRGQLISHFMLEAALLVLIATMVALALVELCAPFVSDLLAAPLDLDLLTTPGLMALIGGLVLAVVIAAGLYPAYLASAAAPGTILAREARGGSSTRGLRNVLVVFQFSVSIALAIGAAVIWHQLDYARSAELGFDKDDVVLIYGVRRGPQQTIDLTRKIDQSISNRPGIVAVSAAGSPPGWQQQEASVGLANQSPDEASVIKAVAVDLDYFNVLKVAPIAGRLFSEDFGSDLLQWDLAKRSEQTMPVVLNQRALATYGFSTPEAAIGALLTYEPGSDGARAAEVVGVVSDMHFTSLRDEIQPAVYYLDPGVFNLIMVRIDPNQRDIAMQSAREGWDAAITQSFGGEYLSEALAQQYENEAREMKTVTALAGLGILVAIFGQYGLAAYSAQARRREISIRKVMGARVGDVIRLFLWQFSKPVVIAMLVAWPLAFLAMSNWLETFVYRVTPNPLWFILAGALALSIALVTVAGHAWRAASAKPIEALRHD